ncbi:MAG: TolC family protein, partial [Duncaniella sp.]|nr:TolC family protein [Duncaniella sp.]
MKRTVVTTLFLALLLSVFAADVNRVELTLPETIDRARTRSVNAAVALDKLRRAYWQHRSYRASLLPEVAFEATVPAFRKQYSVYQFESGEFGFVRNNYLDITGTLSLTQNIWATGGTLSLNTSLDYLRQLSGNRYNRFMSIPVALTLNQPLFAVNSIKWDRRIEPVRYAEAMAEFLSETEEVAMTAISYFFNLLSAREEVAIEQQNLSNAVRLHEVAKAKREMGQISGNDLLQMELNELNARSALTDAESNMRAQMFRLRSFLD